MTEKWKTMADQSCPKYIYTVKTLKENLTHASIWDSSLGAFEGICKCIEQHLTSNKELDIQPFFKSLDWHWKKVSSSKEYDQTKTRLCNPTYLSKYRDKQLVDLKEVGCVKTNETPSVSPGDSNLLAKTSPEGTENQQSVLAVAGTIEKLTNELERERERTSVLEKEKRTLTQSYNDKKKESERLTSQALELRDKIVPVCNMMTALNQQWNELTTSVKKKGKGKRSAPQTPLVNNNMNAADAIKFSAKALNDMENLLTKLHEMMKSQKEFRELESWVSTSVGAVKTGNTITPEKDSTYVKEGPLSKIKTQMVHFFDEYLTQQADVSSLKQELSRLQQERQDIDAKCHTIEQSHSKLNTDMISKDEEVRNLHELMTGRGQEIDKLKEENDMFLQRQTQSMEAISNLKQQVSDAASMSQENRDLRQTIKRLEQEMIDREGTIQHEQDAKEKLSERFQEEMLSKDEEIKRMKICIENKSKEIEKIEEQKSKLLSRISKEAGAKLTDNNSTICDLSDPNRPTKLAEMFSELYDNEWTEAFEEVLGSQHCTKEMNEKETIGFLLHILSVTNDYCRKHVVLQWKEILDAVCQLSTDESQIPTVLIKDLRNVRKMTAAISAEGVAKRFFESGLSSINHMPEEVGGNLELYTRRCVEVCWLMSTQNPPLSLYKDVKAQDTFQEDLFQFYTCGGTAVDYLVWPALLCEENGNLLRKGVCQGMKIK